MPGQVQTASERLQMTLLTWIILWIQALFILCRAKTLDSYKAVLILLNQESVLDAHRFFVMLYIKY